MRKTFLNKLEKPIIALAPMDGITDEAFRLITLKYSNPSFVYTEFVPVDGLVRGIPVAFDTLKYSQKERPIIAQIYGKDPLYFYLSAQIVAELGFDGIDINMGCPAKRIEQHGSGAALIKDFNLSERIITETLNGLNSWKLNGIEYEKFEFPIKVIKRIKKFVEYYKNERDNNLDISISVKTRIGYDKPVTKDWMQFLSGFNLDMIALHGRTLKQQYTGKANWEEIALARETVKNFNKNILFLGNGDVTSFSDALEKIKKFSLDGVLVGRATIGNPWFFKKESSDILTQKEIFNVMMEHAKLFVKIYGEDKFVKLRKFFAKYIKGFEGASRLRSELVRANNLNELQKILKMTSSGR